MANEKLQPKRGPSVQVNPIIRVPKPQVTMNPADNSAIAQALTELGNHMRQIASIQADTLTTLAEVMRALNSQEAPKITVNAPKATNRGRDFYVEFDKEDGETVGMRVRSISPD